MMFVVTCAAGKELDAAASIRRFGYSAFVPRAIRRYRHRNEIHRIAEVLFPGYVFIELYGFTHEHYYNIISLSSVGRFLSQSALPPDEEAHIKMLATDDTGISKARLENGNLQVISGWLKKYENHIVKYSVRQHKATVEINIYGKPHRFVCSVDIEKA